MTEKIQAPEGGLAAWLTDILPHLPVHPEPHTHTWTALEARAIERYGADCARAALAAQAQLDLRDDVIETLRGDLAQERALCEERGRKLYGDDAGQPQAETAGEIVEMDDGALVPVWSDGTPPAGTKLYTQPKGTGSTATFGALKAVTAECNKLKNALELACGYLTEEQVSEIVAAMPSDMASRVPTGWDIEFSGRSITVVPPQPGEEGRLVDPDSRHPGDRLLYSLCSVLLPRTGEQSSTVAPSPAVGPELNDDLCSVARHLAGLPPSVELKDGAVYHLDPGVARAIRHAFILARSNAPVATQSATDRERLNSRRWRFAFTESDNWQYAVCKWDGDDWIPINTAADVQELDDAMGATNAQPPVQTTGDADV